MTKKRQLKELCETVLDRTEWRKITKIKRSPCRCRLKHDRNQEGVGLGSLENKLTPET